MIIPGVCIDHKVCCESFLLVSPPMLFRKGDRIYHQLRKSGCSLDWDRAVFTMDEVRQSLLAKLLLVFCLKVPHTK